jgi:peptide/nickel transport system substrate-binding protein
VLAGTGDYHAAFSWSNIPTEKLEAVKKTAGGQILAQATPTTHFLAINTQHVTELNVRKALNAAIDRVTALAKFRGANHGNPSLTILSSAMPGYRPHNGLGVGVQGDKKQARSLLNGQTPHLKLAYDSSNSADKRLVTFLQSEFQAVGFTIELAPIGSSAEYWAAIGRKDNPYDLYLDQWGSDIPDGSGVFNHLFDSGTITDADNKNISYLRDQVIDLEILRLQLLIDRDEAAKGYGKLDETILHDDAPIAPLFEQQQLSVFGKDLGGLRVHRVFGTIDVADTYVKH